MSEPLRPADPRPAATVVLLRRGPDGLEVLLTHRPTTMAFAADMHVFPGGAVDAGDTELASELGYDAFEAAAIRELFEEAGVLLADPIDGRGFDAGALSAARAALLDGSADLRSITAALGARLRPDLLAPISRWVTPPFVARRFDVRFFAAELPPNAEASFVGDEVLAHRWVTPRAAVRAMAEGEIGLWVPTSVTLQQLAFASSFGEIRKRLAPGPSGDISVEDAGRGVVRVALPEAGGVGGQPINAYVVGARDVVVVDPGDPSGAAIDAIVEVVKQGGGRIAAIALTSAAPDHAAGAEALAGGLDLPILAGPGAGRELAFAVTEVGDGQRLQAGDVLMTAFSMPGPRPEQLSFATDDGTVLVGDLVGPGPARSIVAPPDMREWRASIERLASLGIRRVMPGHDDLPSDAGAALEEQRRRLMSPADDAP